MEEQINGQNFNLNGSTTIITGDKFNIGQTTTTTNTFMLSYTKKVESVELIENEEGNFIEVISHEYPANGNFSYSFNIPGRTMVKERYGIINGKLQLLKTIRGYEQPGYYTPPVIEWKE